MTPFAAVLIGLCLALGGAAVQIDPELDTKIRLAFLDALVHAGLTHKEASMLLGIDKGQWSLICSGQRPFPSLTRLLALPWNFWNEFIPRLTAVLVRAKVDQVKADWIVRRSA